MARRLSASGMEKPSSTPDLRYSGNEPAKGGEGRPKRGGGRRRPLTEEELRAGKHRGWVGGDWERKGRIQIESMRRGGIRFVDYLRSENYYGMEAERIRAGRWELAQEDLEGKRSHLLVNEAFEVGRFGVAFDYAIAVSLFTHLDMNRITRRMHEVGRALSENGEFYATFIEAPTPAHLESMPLGERSSRSTNFDSNPFHYHFSEIERLAGNVGLEARYIGDWGHPGNQKMVFITSLAADRSG